MLEKIKKTKILGIIGNIMIIISLYCNWATVKSTTINYSLKKQFVTTTDGALALALSIFSLVVIFSEKISPKFFKGLTNVKLTLISSIVQLIILLNIIFSASKIQHTNEIVWNFGLGFYLMCIGVILSLIFPFIYKKDEQK